MITKREKELKAKGYRLYEGTTNREKAYELAKELRKHGYYATVVESASNVIGYHDFAVFVKEKK